MHLHHRESAGEPYTLMVKSTGMTAADFDLVPGNEGSEQSITEDLDDEEDNESSNDSSNDPIEMDMSGAECRPEPYRAAEPIPAILRRMG